MNKVEEAILYALDAHAGTFRDGTEIPYILHPLEAAAIAAALSQDQDVIAAAVLHDVVEDTERSMDEIRRRFGERVAYFVGCDTENKRPERPPEETWQIRKQETVDEIPHLADDELVVVFADKFANLRSIWNDYLTIGEELWKRFSQPDPKAQLWYYRGICDACARLAGSPLYREYEWRITEIEKRVQARWNGDVENTRAQAAEEGPLSPEHYSYYYVERLELVGRSYDNFLRNEVYQPGKGWVWDVKHEIGDRLVGYDPYEEPGWRTGNEDIMREIRKITREEAEELIGRIGGGKR